MLQRLNTILTIVILGLCSAVVFAQNREDVDARQKLFLDPDGLSTSHSDSSDKNAFEDSAFEIEDTVELSDHFSFYDMSAENAQKFDYFAGTVISGTGALSIAHATILKNRAEEFKRKHKNIKKSKFHRMIHSFRSSKIPSKVYAGGGLYLMADAGSGLVLAMFGYDPVYMVNNPALAGYLSRRVKESSQTIRGKISEATPDLIKHELEVMKKTIFGEMDKETNQP